MVGDQYLHGDAKREPGRQMASGQAFSAKIKPKLTRSNPKDAYEDGEQQAEECMSGANNNSTGSFIEAVGSYFIPKVH